MCEYSLELCLHLFVWMTVLITMNHYLGICQGHNGRFTIELHLQLFSPYCAITVYDFETKRTSRISNRQFNFQARETPTDPEKEWQSNHKIQLRAICYRMPDSCQTHDVVQKIPMNFEISWTPCWVNVRWQERELYCLVSIRPRKKETWATSSIPPPDLPKLYHEDKNRDRPNTHSNPTNHEPNTNHEPSSSSGVNHEPAPNDSIHKNPDELVNESETFLDRSSNENDDSSIIRGDEHIREYSPDEFVTAFGWGVTFTIDADGVFRDDLVEYSDFLVPSHLVAMLDDRWFPEENRELPFTEYTHDFPEFQIEVPDSPVIHTAPVRPPPAFNLPKSPPPPPPVQTPPNHLVVHKLIHSKSLPLVPVLNMPPDSTRPLSIHTQTGTVHPVLPLEPFRPAPGLSAPNPLLTDHSGHRFELTPAAVALRLEPEANHPRLTREELLRDLRPEPKAPLTKAPPQNVRSASTPPPSNPETDPEA